MDAPGEDAAIRRDSLPLASRGFRMVEGCEGAIHRPLAKPRIYRRHAKNQQHGGDQPDKNYQIQSRLRPASETVTVRGIP
jgi:hypothetical protein